MKLIILHLNVWIAYLLFQPQVQLTTFIYSINLYDTKLNLLGESGTTACPCGVESYSPELILDTVLCNDCYYKQHIWCLGYIKSTDIASDYSCLNCSKKSDYKPIFDSFPEDSLNSQRLLALLRYNNSFKSNSYSILLLLRRVSVMYLRSKNGEKSTVPFLNKLTTDLQKKLVTQLHKLKIVETKKGK